MVKTVGDFFTFGKTKTMKKLILLLAMAFPMVVMAQPKSTKEISIGVNSIEPFSPAYNSLIQTEAGSNMIGNNNNNSLSFGILGKYFIAENTALRLRISLTLKEINNVQVIDDDPSASYGVIDLKFKQRFLKFSPGYQWGIVSNKISFFGGLELPITAISELEYTDDTYLTANGNVAADQDVRTTQPGGFAIGLGFFLGSNYYFSKHFGVGFEVNSAFQHSYVGGDISSVYINHLSGDTTNVETHALKTKETKFTNLQASLNLIYKL